MKVYNVITETSYSGATATPYRCSTGALSAAETYAGLRGCEIFKNHGIENCIYFAANQNGTEAVWVTEHTM